MTQVLFIAIAALFTMFCDIESPFRTVEPSAAPPTATTASTNGSFSVHDFREAEASLIFIAGRGGVLDRIVSIQGAYVGRNPSGRNITNVQYADELTSLTVTSGANVTVYTTYSPGSAEYTKLANNATGDVQAVDGISVTTLENTEWTASEVHSWFTAGKWQKYILVPYIDSDGNYDHTDCKGCPEVCRSGGCGASGCGIYGGIDIGGNGVNVSCDVSCGGDTFACCLRDLNVVKLCGCFPKCCCK